MSIKEYKKRKYSIHHEEDGGYLVTRPYKEEFAREEIRVAQSMDRWTSDDEKEILFPSADDFDDFLEELDENYFFNQPLSHE